MALQWYIPPVLFLVFIICTLFVLVLVYLKAKRYLQGQSYVSHDDDDAVDVAEEDNPKAITFLQESAIPEEGINVEETKTFSGFTQKTIDLEDEIIADATLELALKYHENNRYLSGFIDNICGLNKKASSKFNYVRFHITVLPEKREKFKSKYRSLRDLSSNVMFALRLNDLRNASLRIRLYGRRMDFGVPFGKEKCIGEVHVELNKYLIELEADKEVRTKYAILPRGDDIRNRKS